MRGPNKTPDLSLTSGALSFAAPFDWVTIDIILEHVESQAHAFLLPFAEAVQQTMIAAEFSLGGVDLPEGERNRIPPKAGNSEKRINPLSEQIRK
jgi:hypothetical protein